MVRKTILFLLLALFCLSWFCAACALPPDYAIRKELYPGHVNYGVRSEKEYKVFRVSDNESIIGYMLSIPTDNGTIFLKIDTYCVLETALLHQVDGKNERKYPIYQLDWGQSLEQLAERENLRPMITHFITHHYTRDMEEVKRGSMFSIF